MADSLDNFTVLFRHVITMRGQEAPFNKRDSVMTLSDELGLDKKVFSRIFEYGADEDVWLEWETNEVFGKYLEQIERVIEAVDH